MPNAGCSVELDGILHCRSDVADVPGRCAVRSPVVAVGEVDKHQAQFLDFQGVGNDVALPGKPLGNEVLVAFSTFGRTVQPQVVFPVDPDSCLSGGLMMYIARFAFARYGGLPQMW